MTNRVNQQCCDCIVLAKFSKILTNIAGKNVLLKRFASSSIFTARYYACPSVGDVEVSWSHRWEYFENNFTAG